MPNKFIAAWRDFDNDRQQVSYDVSAATTVADFTGFMVALEAWLCGASGGGGFFDEESVDGGVPASTPVAQSKSQAIIEVIDTVNSKPYKYRAPFPDLTKAADVGTNPAFAVSGGLTVFNPDHADYATLETEIETHLLSPNGNPVTLSRIYIEE